MGPNFIRDYARVAENINDHSNHEMRHPTACREQHHQSYQNSRSAPDIQKDLINEI